MLTDKELRLVFDKVESKYIKGDYREFVDALLQDNAHVLIKDDNVLTYSVMDNIFFITYYHNSSKKQSLYFIKEMQSICKRDNLVIVYKADDENQWENHSEYIGHGCYKLKLRSR